MPSQKLKLKLSHGMDIVDTITHTDMDTMVTILERDLPMLNQKQHQKLKLMPSHGELMEDITATPMLITAMLVTHTLIIILERDLLMPNQKLKPSHGTDIEATMEAIEATDIVVTTGDRFLFPQN